MKMLSVIAHDHSRFSEVCDFANAIYQENLGAGTRVPPDILIAMLDDSQVYGCIGLNLRISSSLFLNDPRFVQLQETFPKGIQVGEQSIFAVRGCAIAVPLLISAVAALAHQMHIHKIAYAGIAVSNKTVRKLGFSIQVLGHTQASVFSEEERTKYLYWIKHYKPVSCILDTEHSLPIYKTVMNRFAQKAKPDATLSINNR